jgi:hypothetical protein
MTRGLALDHRRDEARGALTITEATSVLKADSDFR